MASPAPGLAQVGARLRSLRQARGWTLDDLASQAGMSTSTLSRLEAGKRQASLELLLPLTRRLGVRIDDLLPDEPADPRVRRPSIHRDGHVLVPLAQDGSPVATYKITYPPRADEPALRVHDGFEWLYVLSGRLHLRLAETVTVLSKGEAAEFDTRTPHAMWAGGGRPAQVISIFNRDGERLHVQSPHQVD